MSIRSRFENPPPFALTEALFLRLLGLVYLAAFASLWPQIAGLIGTHGIAPAAESLTALHDAFGAKAYFYVPTLLWLNAGNGALLGTCAGGCVASVMLLSGLFSRYAAGVCFALYLSLTAAGQPFTGFQWDALLLECGFLALFSGAPWLIWAFRFLLFRLMFESGVVKLTSHDPNWRNLHALRFHFLTQPLPTPLAYYLYQAPGWLLDSLTAITLAIELLAPFLLFLPRRWRFIAAALFVTLQVAILLTGNYAFFNLLTLSLCLWCFDDATYRPLRRMLERTFPRQKMFAGTYARIANGVLAVLMLAGGLQVFADLVPASRRIARAISFPIEPFEIVNSYGLFASMTTSRPEIILEGSEDKMHWTEYNFRYKPGDLHRGLPLVAPYQPRLDWQLWFAALGPYRQNPWVAGLVYRLLLNEPSVMVLLEPSPFPKPPKYIRALVYEYKFSTPDERKRTGVVWQRDLLGNWLGPVSLPANTVDSH
jgi:uncharacterized membrane protein YphA (DoxX/SURF4 family)